MDDSTFILLSVAWPIALLLVTYLIGRLVERRHFANIRRRENENRGFPVVTFPELPASWQPVPGGIVTGSVVISLDYFKRFVAALRALVGGRVRSYEPLLDRARREAILRLIEDAKRRGYQGVSNVRLETARLASSRGDGKGTAGIEILAFGTACKVVRPTAD